jgi:glutathione S-transferase
VKLYQSPTSPFARKVKICADELGLIGEIEMLDVTQAMKTGGPLARDENIIKHNPLGQIPTMLIEHEFVLADSRVICEYLNHRAGGALFPTDPAARWRALFEQSLGDGIVDAGLLIRYENTLRPTKKRWAAWNDAHIVKMLATADMIERSAQDFADRIDIGTIACACALGYLDFRFVDLEWRRNRPAAAAWYAGIEARASFATTRPLAG